MCSESKENGFNSHVESVECKHGNCHGEIKIWYCDERGSLFLEEPKPETSGGFEKEYKRMPVSLCEYKVRARYDDYADADVKELCSVIYQVLNITSVNPLTQDEYQQWIGENMDHGHTSMSVADVLEIHGDFWYTKNVGFERLNIEASEVDIDE